MKFWTEPIPSNWDRWEARLAKGEEPAEAARGEHQTCSNVKRSDPVRHAEALALSRRVRAVRRAQALNLVREEARVR